MIDFAQPVARTVWRMAGGVSDRLRGLSGAQERAGQQAGDGEVLRGEPRAQPLRLGMATLDQRQVRA